MTLEILLSAGPNIHGLGNDREILFVAYEHRSFQDNDDITWYVLHKERSQTGCSSYQLEKGSQQLSPVPIISIECAGESLHIRYADQNAVHGFFIDDARHNGSQKKIVSVGPYGNRRTIQCIPRYDRLTTKSA